MKKNYRKLILIASFSAIGGLSNHVNAQWVQVNNGLTDMDVNTLAVSGSNLFAGTGSLSSNSSGNNGVFLSTDDGDTWTEKNTGLVSINPPYNGGIYCFAFSGSDIYIGTDIENTGSVFKSTDNGSTWTGAYTGIPTGENIYALAIDGSNIYAGGDDAVYYSNDNGASWTTSASVTGTGGEVIALAVSGSNIFAGCGSRGVFLSTDNGSTWTAMNTGLGTSIPYADIQTLAVSGTNIFAGSNGGGVFLSTDNGASWTAVNNGLTSPLVKSLAVVGNKLFAGTEYYGTFLSTDNGSNWVTTASTGQSVLTLAYNSTYLFAGTESDGVWRRPLSEMTSTSGIAEAGNSENISFYPNPSSTGKFMIYSNDKINFIEIYNVMGEKVLHEQIVNTINLSNSPKGIYSARIIDGDRVYTKKIIVQ